MTTTPLVTNLQPLPKAALPPLIEWAALAAEVSEAVRTIGPDKVVLKADNSPVTAADLEAHRLIATFLEAKTPHIPVLSEEGDIPQPDVWQTWRQFWCVDPIDGTQSFVDGRDDYSVNIGLIEDGQPVFGMLALPGRNELYLGGVATNAVWQGDCSGQADFQVLPTPTTQPALPTVAISHHKSGRRMLAIHHALETACQREPVPTVSGSGAYKFALLANGSAQVYPRLVGCKWWDTAAGHSLVRQLGMDVVALDADDRLTAQSLRYEGSSLENPPFIACLPQWHHALRG